MDQAGKRAKGGGWRQRVPVRVLMTALIVSLLAVVSVELSMDVLSHLDKLNEARLQQRNERIIGHLVRAAQHLAFERGRTNVLLRAPEPVGADDRAFLTDRRQQADREFDAALQLLDDHGVTLARKLTHQGQVLGALRGRADVLLALPQAERDPLFPSQWMNSLSTQLGVIPEAIYLLGGADRMPPLARVSLQAFDLRNALGLESSHIASALAEQRIPAPEILNELARLRGQSDTAMANLRREVLLTGSLPLVDALTCIDTDLVRNFKPLQDAVLHALLMGRLPQETSQHYTHASVPALDSVAAIMSVAASEGENRASANLSETCQELALYGTLLAVALLLALAALVAMGQVLASAEALRRHLGDLADGRIDPLPPAAPVGRELVDLTRTAQRLRQSLLDRRRLEAELAEVSRQNRLVLDYAADGMIAVDERGNTAFVNPAGQRLLGWTQAEMEGRSCHRLIHHSHADGRPYDPDESPVFQTLVDGISRRVEDDVFWRKDGTSFPVEISVSAWTDGVRHGAVLTFHDISKRRRAQDRNQALLEELRRSNAELETFAYAISHDLQTPLRTVASHVELSRRALADTMDEGIAEMMAYASDAAKRMAGMIGALLDYARLNTQAPAPQAVDLQALSTQVVADLHSLLQETGGSVTIRQGLPSVLGDPVQMGVLVQNLVINGLKYGGDAARPPHGGDAARPPHGGDAARPPHVVIDGERFGDQAILRVCDNGPGIPADQRQRLFGLFARGDQRPGTEGLGMGLAICLRIVSRAGGEIIVSDAPEGGACFSVFLPCVDGIGAPDAPGL